MGNRAPSRRARARGHAELDGPALVEVLTAALAAVQDLGAAQPGDKTMVDALAPALAALRDGIEAGDPVDAALAAAADAAEEGARATTPMQARKGRASYLGERSVGHQDPGATSTALMVRALGTAFVTRADHRLPNRRISVQQTQVPSFTCR